MGLLNVTRDTSLAYKGVVPSMADTFSSTRKEFGYTASGVQSHNVLSGEFENQLKIAKSVAPELFTEQTFTAEMFYRQTKEYGQEKADAKWSAGQVDDPNQDILWRNHEGLMKKFPDAGFKDLDTIYSEGGERVAASMKQSEYDWEHSDTISGTLGWLGGTVVGAAEDPYLAISMFIPVGRAAKGAAGFLGATAKVGLLESAIETGIQAGTFQFKKDIGLEPTFEQAVADIAAVGLSAVLIYGGGSALIRGFKSRLKSGETPNTPQARQQLSDLEQADDLVKEIKPASPEELQARMEELRMAQSEALTTGRIDGATSEIELVTKQTNAIDSNIASIESDISALAKQRDELVGAIDQQKVDIKRAVELESVVTGKLSRTEKKQLKKEITEAMAKGEEATIRIQSRTDASYDQMIGTGDVSFNKAAASTRAKNSEIRRPVEEQMARLEARFDAGEAADSAVNELRALKVRLSDSALDPTETALKVNELNARIKSNDQELFGLQIERGEAVKPKPAPVYIEAIDQAIDADIEAATTKSNSASSVADANTEKVSLPSSDKFRASPVTEKENEFRTVMPTFQGGKQKVSDSTYNIIRKYWSAEDRANITEIDDYFGGGGAWGIYNALSHFTNVEKVRVYEFDPNRMKKIQFFHKHGDKIEEIVENSKGLQNVFNIAVKYSESIASVGKDTTGRDIATGQSPPVFARQIRNSLDKVELNETEIGLAYAMLDLGNLSRGTQFKLDLTKTPADRFDSLFKKLVSQGKEARKAGTEAEKRGIMLEYHQGDSYGMPNPKGDHVLAVVDPPYYFTSGYSPSGKPETVGIDTYAKTKDLLARLDDSNNHILYTDEAWWSKRKEDGKTGESANVMPSDMHNQVDGMNAFDMVNEISGNMTDFVTMPVGKRTETLGLRNAFRNERNATNGSALGTEKRGFNGELTRRGSGVTATEGAGRVVGESSSTNRAVPSAKLDGPTKQDIPIDDLVAADIAKAQDVLSKEEIDIPTVDEYGNEVLRPASEILAKLDSEALTIERILECGKQ
tara:strand:- start:2436 stop:5528 length:3093 start_codon:yes stop_codon:yes gene_type:complete